MPSTMTTTAAAAGAGTSLALGPQALKPVIGFLAEYHQLQPLPSEDAQLGIATLAVFFGGGVIWFLVTVVKWAMAKRGIIKEETNASV